MSTEIETKTINNDTPTFAQLDLIEPVHKMLEEVGYTEPTSIQSQIIPLMLEGHDVIGQAQTGTGKTAAFALPLLSKINPSDRSTQVLVMAPTRELAIQVADNFKKYASKMKSVTVLPVYGGQDYNVQLRALHRGVQIVVGTPGRLMDHLRRGTLKLDDLSCIVLDEADEMLRMGFIDDVEWVMQQTPDSRQVALFSATMPPAIRKIAQRYLNDPKQISIKNRTTAADTIRQRYWLVNRNTGKTEAFCRILEHEETNGILVFMRTRLATTDLVKQLEDRGFLAGALNGDMSQNMREQTVDRFKKGRLNILVATDVAARGLDVERISHVFNYDVPDDAETYVHRIGRTGRAGRKGEAISFVHPREKRMVRVVGNITKQTIHEMQLPSIKAINEKRVERFAKRITDTVEFGELEFFKTLITEYQETNEIEQLDIAAALAKLYQGNIPLLLKEEKKPPRPPQQQNNSRSSFSNTNSNANRQARTSRSPSKPEKGMERYNIAVGAEHGVKPGNIVGAIANEAGLDSEYIGRINIFDNYSTVDLPEGMPSAVFKILKKVWVCDQQLKISRGSKQLSDSPKTLDAKSESSDNLPLTAENKKQEKDHPGKKRRNRLEKKRTDRKLNRLKRKSSQKTSQV